MFIIGIYVRTNPPVKGADIPPFGYVALVCKLTWSFLLILSYTLKFQKGIFLFAAFFQFGWGPVCWILVSEIPTARLRAMNVAIAAATQWLFNFVVAQAVPRMLANVGKAGYGTYFIFGSFCFSMFIFVWFLIPETKGISLEKMDNLFGVIENPKLASEEAGMHSSTTKPNVHQTTADAIAHEKAAEPIHVESK